MLKPPSVRLKRSFRTNGRWFHLPELRLWPRSCARRRPYHHQAATAATIPAMISRAAGLAGFSAQPASKQAPIRTAGYPYYGDNPYSEEYVDDDACAAR